MREWKCRSRKLKPSSDKYHMQHFRGFARLESETIKYHNIFAGLRLESDTWPRQYEGGGSGSLSV